MTVFWTIAASIVPWAAGIGLVRSCRDRDQNLFLAVGEGWLVGQILVVASLYATFVATGAAHAKLILAVMACLAVFTWRRPVRRAEKLHAAEMLPGSPIGSKPARSRHTMPWPSQFLLAIIGLALLSKLFFLAGAHAWIPSRGDDAMSIWLFKAKSIAILDELPRDKGHDYYLGGSNPRYPVFAPLAAAWIPLVNGGWNEHLATLPWLGFYLSLLLIVAGGLRRWLSWTASWVAAYLVASLPLLVIHVYRPGYVDLFVAVFLAATVSRLLSWRSSGALRQLLWALLFATTAACLKRESPVIAAVAVLSVMTVSLRQIRAMSPHSFKVLIPAAATAILLVATAVDVSDVSDNLAAAEFHPEVWPVLARHLFQWSSFQFLGCAVFAGAGLVLFLPKAAHRWPGLLLLTSLLVLDAAVFLLTPQAVFALNDQTPSRLYLQVLPAIVVALAVPLGTGLGLGRLPEELEVAEEPESEHLSGGCEADKEFSRPRSG